MKKTILWSRKQQKSQSQDPRQPKVFLKDVKEDTVKVPRSKKFLIWSAARIVINGILTKMQNMSDKKKKAKENTR